MVLNQKRWRATRTPYAFASSWATAAPRVEGVRIAGATACNICDCELYCQCLGSKRVEKWNWHWRHPGALLIGFLVLLALGMCLVIPHWSHYHGDEGFYTNAAIRMTQTGDYW